MTDTAIQLLERRERDFPRFLEERMDVLADFASRIGLDSPKLIVAHPTVFADAIDDYMALQDIGEEELTWIMTRIGYYIGEVLIERNSGCWVLLDDASSKFFARYVIGRFPGSSMVVDPFEAAADFVRTPKGRSLLAWISRIEDQLRHHSGEADTGFSSEPD